MNSDRSPEASDGSAGGGTPPKTPGPNPRAPGGEELSRLLADYDDALARGAAPPALAAELVWGLRDDLDLLRRLDRLRPSAAATPSPAASPIPRAPAEGGDETRYELRALLAVGGVGEIWLARDLALDRDVALKVLRPEREADRALAARFLREARITARLQHPGIVPVYEMVSRLAEPGGEEQPPFYTMRLVPGHTLAEAVQAFHARRRPRAAAPLDLNALLTAFVSVCQTVAYAHSRGVIHRDLKPSNIALGDFGEVVVLDWGLAHVGPSGELDSVARREEDESSSLEATPTAALGAIRHQTPGRPRQSDTLVGDVLGTPAYMAPEQASGRPEAIDARTDVYGLGAILYEILTGRPPYQGHDAKDILRQVRESNITPPRAFWRGAPAALEAVCLKAVARDPGRRYASAAEVAREVQHWLADEPVAAYPEPAVARLRRWCRRHQSLVSGAAALLLATLLVGGVALNLVRQEQALTAETRAQAAITQGQLNARSQRVLHQQLYFHRIALAERTLAANNPSRAFQLLEECPIPVRAWEWHCLKRMCHAGVTDLRGHTGTVAAVAFSPDGRWLASASFDGSARLWGVAEGRPGAWGRSAPNASVRPLQGHDNVVYHLAFSPDSRRLATASWDRTARIWDVRTGACVCVLRGHSEAVNRVAFRPDGKELVTLSNDRTLRFWDAESGRLLRTLSAELAPRWAVNHLAYSPDGQLLALVGPDSNVRLWDAVTCREVSVLEGHGAVTRAVAFSRDGRLLASGDGEVSRSDPGEIRIWRVPDGRPLWILRGHTDAIYSVAFSPDGHRLVSASADQTVKLWDLATGQEALTLHGHTDQVRSAEFSPDGLRLATAGADKVIRLWDGTPWSEASPTRELRTLPGPTARLFGAAVRPDGRRWAAVGEYMIRTWEGDPGVLAGNAADARTYELPHLDFFALAFRPNSGQLATAGSDGSVLLLDAAGRVERTLPSRPSRHGDGHAGGPIKGLAFTPDGRRLASASWDRTVRVWDVDEGRTVLVLRDHTEPVLAVAVSPDGSWVASASADRTVKVWDANTGAVVRTLTGHTGGVQAVQFSPQGDLLASAGRDKSIRLWKVPTWQEMSILHGHTAPVRALAFSPGGGRLASGSDDWTIRVWRPETGEELATLRGHTGRISGVAFTPDRSAIISASYDGTVKVWDGHVGARHPE
jgi:WD40 repeat protein/serine/threonine protein kinase